MVVNGIVSVIFVATVVVFVIYPGIVIGYPMVAQQVAPNHRAGAHQHLTRGFIMNGLVALPIGRVTIILFAVQLDNVSKGNAGTYVPTDPRDGHMVVVHSRQTAVRHRWVVGAVLVAHLSGVALFTHPFGVTAAHHWVVFQRTKLRRV